MNLYGIGKDFASVMDISYRNHTFDIEMNVIIIVSLMG
jgi:hypothetical protein